MIASVIIPTRNRPGQIHACLDALARQVLPAGSFEVIVVDDGSTNPLALNPAAWAHAFALTLIRQANSGPAGARNRGAQEARADILAFTDDDCCPEPDWLAHMVDALQRSPRALVGGSTENALKDSTGAETSQFILELVYEYFNHQPDGAYFFASNNMACRRDTFHAIGGFDREFPSPAAEDREFCDRWRMSRHPLVWRRDARIRHRHPQTFIQFTRLHFRYGIGAFLYQDRRTARKSGTIHQDLGFHRALPRQAWRHLRGTGTWHAFRILIYLIAWQIANAAGFIHGWLFYPRSQRALDLEQYRGYPIVVQRRGGAGNQLFQYAAARQAARIVGAPVRFTPTDTRVRVRDIQLEDFIGPLVSARNRDLFRFLLLPPNAPCWMVEWNRRLRRKLRWGRVVWKREGGVMEQIEQSFWGHHLLFDAYFQDPAFFKNGLAETLAAIAARRPANAPVMEHVISVNIRTGRDFQALGWTLPWSYYERAIERLDPDHSHTVWLVGDERGRLDELAARFRKSGRDVAIAPALTDQPPWDDFWNMARTRKLVMSRSTYCWWAATMNDHLHDGETGRIIAPVPWLPSRAGKIIPHHWIPVDAIPGNESSAPA